MDFTGNGFQSCPLARLKSGYAAIGYQVDVVVAGGRLRQGSNQVGPVRNPIGAAELLRKTVPQFQYRQLLAADGIADSNTGRGATVLFKCFPYAEIPENPDSVWAQLQACAYRFKTGGLLKYCGRVAVLA